MTTCVLTGTVIRWGAPCVLIPLAPAFRDGTSRDHAGYPGGASLVGHGACSVFEPVLLPLFGRCGEYGTLERIEESDHARYLSARFGVDVDTIAQSVTEGHALERLTKIAARLYREEPASDYRRKLRWRGRLYGCFVAREAWDALSAQAFAGSGWSAEERTREIDHALKDAARDYRDAVKARRLRREQHAERPESDWRLIASSVDAATRDAMLAPMRSRIARFRDRKAPEVTRVAITPREVEQVFTDPRRRYVVTLRAILDAKGHYGPATAWAVERRAVTEPSLEGPWQPDIAFPSAAWEALKGRGYRDRVPYRLHVSRLRDWLAPETVHVYGRRLFEDFAADLRRLALFESNASAACRLLAPTISGSRHEDAPALRAVTRLAARLARGSNA